ncbi:nucleoside recognition protein [candidate division KSB1 bacterium]|nr:nucleoside recognition protein [candidate division KSB1 bacterium]
MLNYFWLALIVIAILLGAINGRITEVTNAAIKSAEAAVTLALGLIGVMALWLGLMKIAEQSGIITWLARLIRPITRWLFPDVPADHPALGSVLMNVLANWFGLGNAATPLGLKAMQELQAINPKKDTASDAMVLFLALNTATICLIPATMIAIRSSSGAANPTEIIAPTILASTCATLVAITTAKILGKLSWFKRDLTENSDPNANGQTPEEKKTNA